MSKADSGVFYIGEGQFLVGIPATDLTAGELDALAESRGEKPNALRDRLLASDLYRVTNPDRKGSDE